MESVEIAIVGAGPVGLTLAGLLAQRGVTVAVLERRRERSPHSRAIGIHPPAQDVLRALGLGEALATEAVAIGGGQVFYGESRLGRLALPEAPMALPQARTETLLEAHLKILAPRALRLGAEVSELKQGIDCIQIFCKSGEALTAKLLVGCDGTNSTVRTLADIKRTGSTYPDRYLMGDFTDNTAFGSDAALFFSHEGIVESFPLPHCQRRWVARLRDSQTALTVDSLGALVFARTGQTIPLTTCSWLSPFGIEGFVAETFLKGRVALLGDAAHVVSPIGGQGMNLGILGADTLAQAWNGLPESLEHALATHHHVAKRVARRAAFNTHMGRPLPALSARRALITLALRLPRLSQKFGEVFTMRDLA
ncbi:NAD(P)/FAD-dependent oxidoreductase [Armatimonas sp.]|uniref:FAD-dependent oxidoreductase n=1 Tax=Armatimonas sp. TaxID=1872638 RepID=UPI00286C0655|nr:NAD(P)/FAD-dependent oxidoreductase [Armatimonas sp.]